MIRKDTIWALDKDRLSNTTAVEDTIIVTVFDGIDNLIQNKYSRSELFIRAFEKTFYDVGGCAAYTAILKFYAEDFYGAINAAKAVLEYNPNSAFAQSVLMQSYAEISDYDNAKVYAASILANDEAIDRTKQIAKEISQMESSTSRRVTPYYFFHQLLSVIAPQIPIEDGYLLESPGYLTTILPRINNISAPFSEEEIEVSTITRGGSTYYVWKFPEPKGLRDSLYIAFSPYEGKYKAVALSIGQNVDWELSTSTETMRRTYGRVPRPKNAEEFVDLLIERQAYSDYVVPGEFFQEGYTAPDYSK